ncbi:MAG: hypothetical protein AAAC47_03015, partial [Pararhizobium sp.]
MNRNVRFDGNGKKPNPSYGGKSPARVRKIVRHRRINRSGVRLSSACALVALTAAGIYAADHYQVGARLTLAAAAPGADTLHATFPFCGDGRRGTCVVDGDTFWLAGEKIRIADIDTPELSPPRCEAERVKGEAAKR